MIIFILEALVLFDKKSDIIELMLKALFKLVEYDKIMEEYTNNIRNDFLNDNFLEIMERNGIRYILDNYIIDKRKDINIISNKLYKK